MPYFKDLREHIAALEKEGLLVKIDEQINKDTELMPLVRWQIRGLSEEERRAFIFTNVVDAKGRLVGMITDGDLRRHMGTDLLKARVADIMTRKPYTLTPGTLASAALEQINSLKRTQMFVIEKGKPIGIVHVHDLLRAGVA